MKTPHPSMNPKGNKNYHLYYAIIQSLASLTINDKLKQKSHTLTLEKSLKIEKHKLIQCLLPV